GSHWTLPFDERYESSGLPSETGTSRLISRHNRKSERLPIMDTGFESMRSQAAGAKQTNGVGSQHTEWSAAVSNDLFVARKLGNATLQFRKRDGECTGNVRGPILLNGPDVDHDRSSGTHLLYQCVAINWTEISARLQEPVANLLQLCQPVLTQDP